MTIYTLPSVAQWGDCVLAKIWYASLPALAARSLLRLHHKSRILMQPCTPCFSWSSVKDVCRDRSTEGLYSAFRRIPRANRSRHTDRSHRFEMRQWRLYFDWLALLAPAFADQAAILWRQCNGVDHSWYLVPESKDHFWAPEWASILDEPFEQSRILCNLELNLGSPAIKMKGRISSACSAATWNREIKSPYLSE